MIFSTRARAAAFLLAGVFGVAAAAQAPVPVFRALVADLSSPGIDRGLRDNDPPRDPRTSANQLDPEPFVRGSIIVKFRAGTSAAAQRAMLASVNGAATQAPTYANFDIVAIDAAADPEAAARRLDAQPDVDYAQARYRVAPMFTPNDPFYSRQWNYPAIDMERAWDINPGAASDIVVAVLDSGVAFRSGVFRFNAPCVLYRGNELSRARND